MKIVFFGTPQLAVPSLEAVHEIGEVVRVICQPDRPAGRGMRLRPPPVKVRALELGLEVEQPRKVKTPAFAESLAALGADVSVVVAYGRILPRAVLDAPKHGSLNIHASLLPRWRGAGPIQWAIVSGDAETGVCLMQMDEGMDTGPVVATVRTPIAPDETAKELGDRLSQMGADLLRDALPRFVAGELPPSPQPSEGATHARMLVKEDGRIPWTDPARAVHDRVRGLSPWPAAFTHLGDQVIRVHQTAVVDDAPTEEPPGTVTAVGPDGIVVACGQGHVALEVLQRPNKRRLPAAEFLKGEPLAPGTRFEGEVKGEPGASFEAPGS